MDNWKVIYGQYRQTIDALHERRKLLRGRLPALTGGAYDEMKRRIYHLYTEERDLREFLRMMGGGDYQGKERRGRGKHPPSRARLPRGDRFGAPRP